MPRKKNAKRSRRLTRYRHRKSRVPRQLITNRFTRTLRYNTSVVLNPTAGVVAYHNYSANGLYDPDLTGAGHQPLGWDQMIGVFYDHAVVIGSKITLNVCPQSGTSSGISLVGVDLRDTTGYALSKTETIEQGRSVWKMTGGTTGGRPQTIVRKCNPNKFLGRSNPLSDPQLKNTISANATESAVWTVWCASPDEAIDPSAVTINVTIEYLTVFLEPKTLSGS